MNKSIAFQYISSNDKKNNSQIRTEPVRERELKSLFGLLFFGMFFVFGVCDNLRWKLYRPVCDIIIYNVMNVHLEQKGFGNILAHG